MSLLSRPPALPTAAAESPHDLVRTGDIERLRDALDAGADPNGADAGGLTPLLLAVQIRRAEAILILGRAGADPELSRLQMGNFTPLHEAAHRDSLEAVQALLEIGADPSRRTWLTPVDWAQSPSVIKALVAADADARCPDTGQVPLHRRACRALPQPIVALLDAGADVAALDLQSRTPLHHVTLGHCRRDVAKTVALLIEAGADPEAVDGNGETVTGLARRHGARDAGGNWGRQARRCSENAPLSASVTATLATATKSDGIARCPGNLPTTSGSCRKLANCPLLPHFQHVEAGRTDRRCAQTASGKQPATSDQE